MPPISIYTTKIKIAAWRLAWVMLGQMYDVDSKFVKTCDADSKFWLLSSMGHVAMLRCMTLIPNSGSGIAWVLLLVARLSSDV